MRPRTTTTFNTGPDARDIAYTGLVYTYDGSAPTGNENPNVTDDPTGLYGTVCYTPLGDRWFRVGAT